MNKIVNVVFFVLIAAAFFQIGHTCGKNAPNSDFTPIVDTLSACDTSTFVEPQNVPSTKVITKEIPVPVFIADSTAIDSLLSECARLERRGDSLQLILIREQRHYSDSTFDAWVSGIDPKLDSIKTYNDKLIITKEIPVFQVKKTRWGIGLQGGVSTGKDGVFPYVGVGVSYSLYSW